jgi:hypothetical protein
MARPQPEPGTFHLCSTHNRYVTAGPGETALIHTSGNQEAACSSQRFTIIVRREATRAEVLAELAAAGEDGP